MGSTALLSPSRSPLRCGTPTRGRSAHRPLHVSRSAGNSPFSIAHLECGHDRECPQMRNGRAPIGVTAQRGAKKLKTVLSLLGRRLRCDECCITESVSGSRNQRVSQITVEVHWSSRTRWRERSVRECPRTVWKRCENKVNCVMSGSLKVSGREAKSPENQGIFDASDVVSVLTCRSGGCGFESRRPRL
jgi:hypothetical protein